MTAFSKRLKRQSSLVFVSCVATEICGGALNSDAVLISKNVVLFGHPEYSPVRSVNRSSRISVMSYPGHPQQGRGPPAPAMYAAPPGPPGSYPPPGPPGAHAPLGVAPGAPPPGPPGRYAPPPGGSAPAIAMLGAPTPYGPLGGAAMPTSALPPQSFPRNGVAALPSGTPIGFGGSSSL